MQDLIVHDTFYTVQGEGYWSGRPAVFVRLQGCNLRCPWCDEPNALEFNRQRKFAQRPMLGPLSPDALFERIRGESALCNYVVLTGGEPTAQELTGLFTRLQSIPGMLVSIETNGTLFPAWLAGLIELGLWVTLSPKPKERPPRPEMVAAASEVKLIIECAQDIEDGLKLYAEQFSDLAEPRIFLQAEDSKREQVLPLIIEAVKARPELLRVSERLHKIWGLK